MEPDDATVGKDLPCPQDQQDYDEYAEYAQGADSDD